MRRILLIGHILSWCVLAQAEDYQSRFNQANAAYRQQEFLEAIQIYESLIYEGIKDDKVYYNLGNAYFKTTQLAPAILNYEKALKLNPSDKNIHYNLSIANAQQEDKISDTNTFFLLQWLQAAGSRYDSGHWAVAMLVCLWLSLAVFVVFLYAPGIRLRKLSFVGGSGMVLLTIVFFLLSFKQYNSENIISHAVIFSPKITMKSKPAKSGTAITTIHQGLKVKVVGAKGQWVRIKLPNAKEGWIERNAIKEI